MSKLKKIVGGASQQLLVIAVWGLPLMVLQTAWCLLLLQHVFLQGTKHSEHDRHYFFWCYLY
jgi:hypothetical protein